MTRFTLSCIVLSALSLSSCASMKTNPFIGAVIGASVGGLAGTAIGSSNHAVTGAVIGTASGAAIGALIGYLTEPKSNQKVKPGVGVIGTDQMDPDTPAMLSPEVRKVWVPDQIEDGGKKYVKGHDIYILERGTVWSIQ